MTTSLYALALQFPLQPARVLAQVLQPEFWQPEQELALKRLCLHMTLIQEPRRLRREEEMCAYFVFPRCKAR